MASCRNWTIRSSSASPPIATTSACPAPGTSIKPGGLGKARGKATGLAACDESVVAAVNDERGTVQPAARPRCGRGRVSETPARLPPAG